MFPSSGCSGTGRISVPRVAEITSEMTPLCGEQRSRSDIAQYANEHVRIEWRRLAEALRDVTVTSLLASYCARPPQSLI